MEVFKTAGGRFFSSRLLKKTARELVWAAKFFTHQIGVIHVASNRGSQDSSTTTWQLEISIGIYQKPVIFPRNTNSTYKLEALIILPPFSIPWVLYLLHFCRQPISTFGSSDLCLPGLTFLFHSHQGECFQNIWSSWCQGQNQKVHPKLRIPKVVESPKESSLFWNAHCQINGALDNPNHGWPTSPRAPLHRLYALPLQHLVAKAMFTSKNPMMDLFPSSFFWSILYKLNLSKFGKCFIVISCIVWIFRRFTLWGKPQYSRLEG